MKAFSSTPIDIAARVTAELYPSYEGLADTLRAWCRKPEFSAYFEEAEKAGELDPTDGRLLALFLTDFYDDNDDLEARATEVITVFLNQLTSELLKTQAVGPMTYNRMGSLESRFQQRFDEQAERIAAIPIEIADLVRSVEEELPQHRELAGQLDASRTLIAKGKVKAAATVLHEIEGDIDNAADSFLKWRWHTNLGACHLAQGELQDAERCFQFALDLRGDDPRSKLNSAVGALLREEWIEAIGLANGVLGDPEHRRTAQTILIQAWSRNGADAELAALSASDSGLEDDAQVCIALGDHRLARKDPSEAERLFRRARALQPTNLYVRTRIARAITDAVRRAAVVSGEPPSAEDLRTVRQLESALAELNVAVAMLSDSELEPELFQSLLDRAWVHEVLANNHEALSDLSRIPENAMFGDEVIRARGAAFFNLRRYDEALIQFERLELDDSVRFLRASALTRLGRYQEAIDLVADTFFATTQHNELAQPLLDAFEALDESRARNRVLAILEERSDGDLDALQILTDSWIRENQARRAVSLLERHHRADDLGPTADRFRSIFANALLNDQQWDRAVTLLEAHGDRSDRTSDTVMLIVALYNGGRYGDALHRIRSSDLTPVNLTIAEIHARLCAFAGDFAEASQLYESMAPRSAKVQPLLESAMYAARSGNAKRASELWGRVDVRTIVSGRDLMAFAQLAHLLGMPDWQNYAYQSLGLEEPDADVVISYFQLAVSAEVEATELVPTVSPECTVRLEREGQISEITLVARRSAAPFMREMLASEDVAVAVLGASLGDKVLLPPSGQEWSIMDIVPKFVGAARKCADSFGAWFPGDSRLERVPVTDDLVSVISRLAEREQYAKEVWRQYEEGQVPLSSLAQWLGRDVTDVMEIGTAGHVIRASTNDPTEHAREDSALRDLDSTGFVVDWSVVATWSALGILDIVGEAIPNLQCPAAMIDEIVQKEAVGGRFESGKYLGMANGLPTFTETTPAEQEARLAQQRRARTWIRQHVHVVPDYPSLEWGRDQVLQVRQVLGETAGSAVLLACGQGSVLLADDLLLRQIAGQFGAQTSWTQRLLRALQAHGRISEEDYRRYVNALAMRGLASLSLEAADFVTAFAADGYQFGSLSSALSRQLKHGFASLDSACAVGSDVARDVWLSALPLPTKEVFLLGLLWAISANRSPVAVARAFLKAVGSRFALNPIHEGQIKAVVSDWYASATFAG